MHTSRSRQNRIWILWIRSYLGDPTSMALEGAPQCHLLLSHVDIINNFAGLLWITQPHKYNTAIYPMDDRKRKWTGTRLVYVQYYV